MQTLVVTGNLGSKVRARRKQCGLTQQAFAESIGRSCSWVIKVERGEIGIDRISVLNELAEHLQVPVTALVDVKTSD